MDNCKEINLVEEHIKEYLELAKENHDIVEQAERFRKNNGDDIPSIEFFAQRLKLYLHKKFSELPAKWYRTQRDSTDFTVFFPQNQDDFDSPNGTQQKPHQFPCAVFTAGLNSTYKYFVKIYVEAPLQPSGINEVADFQIDKANFREKLDEIMLRLARERFFLPGEL